MRADRRGAVKVDVDAIVADRQGADQVDGLVVAVDTHCVAPAALGQFSNIRQHGPAGLSDDPFRDGFQVVQPKFLHGGQQSPRPGVVAGGK